MFWVLRITNKTVFVPRPYERISNVKQLFFEICMKGVRMNMKGLCYTRQVIILQGFLFWNNAKGKSFMCIKYFDNKKLIMYMIIVRRLIMPKLTQTNEIYSSQWILFTIILKYKTNLVSLTCHVHIKVLDHFKHVLWILGNMQREIVVEYAESLMYFVMYLI